MTQEEIIQLAMEYGFTGGFDAEGNLTFDATFVEAVAEAVAKTRKATLEEMIYEHPTTAIKKAVEYAVQVEREKCAKLVEDSWMAFSRAPNHRLDITPFPELSYVAKVIRARGGA